MMNNISDGQELCKVLYKNLGGYYFPALTGGVLYKDGTRKDIDIVIYRHRQDVATFEMEEIETQLIASGLTKIKYFGFVTKAKWNGKSIDLFNPETSTYDSVYPRGDDQDE